MMRTGASPSTVTIITATSASSVRRAQIRVGAIRATEDPSRCHRSPTPGPTGAPSEIESRSAPALVGRARTRIAAPPASSATTRVRPFGLDRTVDAKPRLRRGFRARATAAEGSRGRGQCSRPWCAACLSGRPDRASRHASEERSLHGEKTLTAAERCRWCAGSTPGGSLPSFQSAASRLLQFLSGLDDAAVSRDQHLLGCD